MRAALVVTLVALAVIAVAIGILGIPFSLSAPSPTPRPATASPSAAAASRTPTSAPSTAAPSPSPSPSPSPTALTSARGNIVVERPTSGARVSSPVTVAGRARVFEAAVVWRVVDGTGRELAKGFGTASAGAPEFGTFALPVTFRVSTETPGTIEVYATSPRDGSVDELVRVPVTLLPSR